MTKRQLYRLKKRIKAHLKRAAVILALLMAVVLMICGCLYIGERLFGSAKDTETSSNAGEASSESNNDESGTSDQPLDTDSQILNQYNYTYSKPDATGLSICLDAGHGGDDNGTQSGSVIEKDVNLSITKIVASLLKEAGATVTLVRESDVYVDLANRTTFGNQTEADLFVSLHCNYYEADASIKGLEIYYHRNSETSKQYAESITQLLRGTHITDVRDSSQENMQVLRNSSIPAIMIEMGFLSNAEDLELLSDPLYQEYFARVLVESIVEALNPSTTGA